MRVSVAPEGRFVGGPGGALQMAAAPFNDNSHRGETTIRDGLQGNAHDAVNENAPSAAHAVMIDFAAPFAHKPANVRTAASGDGLPLFRRCPMAQTSTNEKAAPCGG